MLQRVCSTYCYEGVNYSSAKRSNRLNMRNQSNSKLTLWQELLTQLPWTPKQAEHSTRLALSKAQWLGIDRNQAIQAIFEVALPGFFQTQPHVLFETWQSISEQIACPDELALVAA